MILQPQCYLLHRKYQIARTAEWFGVTQSRSAREAEITQLCVGGFVDVCFKNHALTSKLGYGEPGRARFPQELLLPGFEVGCRHIWAPRVSDSDRNHARECFRPSRQSHRSCQHLSQSETSWRPESSLKLCEAASSYCPLLTLPKPRRRSRSTPTAYLGCEKPVLS